MRNIFSVSEVNKYINNKLSSDVLLSHLFIKGEISNFKSHSSGHLYFTIKDALSSLKCVMFKGQAMNLKFDPKDGMNIVIGGYISVFEKVGEYQLYVQDIQPDGLGALHIAYEQLKEKLQAEGLFDESRKKPIPFLPKCIALITSPTGAAVEDMITIITRRFPKINLIIIPVRVQGEFAATEIAEAIEIVNTKVSPDTIIVGRGGGSIEDLWAFNEEIVVRAIANSKIPIISSVGHETDFTISDFVADLRAPTPSAAAELAVPEYSVLLKTISINRQRLISGLLKQLEIKKEKLNSFKNKAVFKMPIQRIREYRQQIDMNSKLINERFLNKYLYKKDSVNILIEKLSILNPLNVVKRGFSVIKNINGKIISSANNIEINNHINVIMNDGELLCQVKDKKSEGDGLFVRKGI